MLIVRRLRKFSAVGLNGVIKVEVSPNYQQLKWECSKTIDNQTFEQNVFCYAQL